MEYTYRENTVEISRHAEVGGLFLPGRDGPFSRLVQEALDQIEPWEEGEDPIHTFDLSRRIGSRVVAVAVEEPLIWAVNQHHKARQPRESPFVRLPAGDPRNTTDVATLQLTGTVEKPELTRVYPGEYMPPLPWMTSARKAPGGVENCTEFWNGHAFVFREKHPPHSITNQAPDWHRQGA